MPDEVPDPGAPEPFVPAPRFSGEVAGDTGLPPGTEDITAGHPSMVTGPPCHQNRLVAHPGWVALSMLAEEPALAITLVVVTTLAACTILVAATVALKTAACSLAGLAWLIRFARLRPAEPPTA